MADPRLNPAMRAGGVVPVERPAPGRRPEGPAEPGAFDAALGRAVGFRFSSHAEQRLQARGVSFDAGQLKRLEQGIDAVAAKGSREALVILDNVAMVIAVRNRTVVTALPSEDAGPAVFTNIDAAVIT